MRGFKFFPWIGALTLCAVAAVLASCTSSGKRVPTPASSARPSSAQPTASSTLGPAQKTAVAAGANVALLPFRDPGGRYTVDLPAGWPGDQGSSDFYIVNYPSGELTTIGIFCQPGVTAAALQAQDYNVATNVGTHSGGIAQPTTVAGVHATEVQSSTRLTSLVLRNDSYYLEGKGCAWRIQLTTAGKADFVPLLRRVIQSFKFTP